MSKSLSPQRTISISHARRFLLAHQHLWPPRQLSGKEGIMDFVRHVGCIQYDPINVVGRNPDLVLQSRINSYHPILLEELLYQDRHLLDGWDKVRSIYLTVDWPYFTRHRVHMYERYGDPSNPPMEIAPDILDAIRNQGPLSSIDLKGEKRINWSWGQQANLAKAALDILYAMGELVIHHKVGTRRVFDLTARLMSEEVIESSDPNELEEDYHEWHVLRRIGGLGIAYPGAYEFWGGILGIRHKTQRMEVLTRLVSQMELIPVAIEEVPNRTFFIRSKDVPTLDKVQCQRSFKAQAAIIAALDNLMWDRSLLHWIFNFEYVWEVYKPKAKRRYGYYVLPVLYGDHFVARFDPAFNREEKVLHIKNWWWEENVEVGGDLEGALMDCFRKFMEYLGAKDLHLDDHISKVEGLRWMSWL